jgi:hypothetical protein
MIDTNLLKNKPVLIKRGQELPLNILSGSTINGVQTLKTSNKKVIGNKDSYEFIGVGDRKITIPVYFNSQEEYDTLFNFVSDGSAMLLACTFFPLVPVNIESDIVLNPYYDGFGTAELKFTTSVNANQNIQELLNYRPQISGIGSGSKKSVLEKLFEFGNKNFNFTSNTNEKIGSFTNTIAAFSAALNNQAQGIATSSSIITNPISSIKSSSSQIVGGISGIVNALQNTVNVIRQVPNDVNNLTETFSQIGDQLNDLFDLGDSNATLKYNIKLLIECAFGIINVDLSQDNPDINTFDSETIEAKFFLKEIITENNKTCFVLILVSILLSIYENAENIDRWNTRDLDDLRTSSEEIYQYITSFKISSDLKLELDLARNNFFLLFKELYNRAKKIISVELSKTKYLTDVVYSVNGNYDNYEDTKILNNIVGNRVIGTIFVISNE